MDQVRRMTTLSVGLFLSACVGVFVAPAAHAQIGLPSTDAVTDAVGDTTEQTTDTVTSTVGDLTDEAEETVEETIDDPGSVPDRVTDVVDDVNEDIPGGPVTDPVKDVVNGVGNTIDEATGGTGSGPLPGTDSPGRSNFGTDPNERRDRNGSSGSDRVLGRGAGTGSTLGSLSPDGIVGALLVTSDESPPAVELTTVGPSFGERAAQIAVEAAKRLAFPMLLLALVGMFLAFHGRVGRKDPKLALAAVDPEQNFVDFR
jgi:hypothetical protein